MTIHPDTEIVASRFDRATQTCFYTLERQGKRWTVGIPLKELEQHGPNKQRRRDHLANRLQQAMRGPHDGESA